MVQIFPPADLPCVELRNVACDPDDADDLSRSSCISMQVISQDDVAFLVVVVVFLRRLSTGVGCWQRARWLPICL